MASTDAKSGAPPKITLHWLEQSRSHRILWLLEELAVPYELKTYKRTKDSLAPPELKAVHPLGKSPVVVVEAPGAPKPLVLAESAAISEYLCDYYGRHLVPKRYPDGQDGQIGHETESWVRYRMLMHYAEGSLQPLMLVALLVKKIRTSSAPFFIKPVLNGVANKLETNFLQRSFKTAYDFLESQLASSPDGGDFLCGRDLTAADIMLSFPLEAGISRSGLTRDQYPKVWAFVDRIHSREAYKRSVAKIVEVEGSFEAPV